MLIHDHVWSYTGHKLNSLIFVDLHPKSFYPQQEYQIMVKDLPLCFQKIDSWMYDYYLHINPGKTEVTIFGDQSVLNKLQIHGSFISQFICVRFVSTVKNLGFRLDSTLSFNKQVMNIKSKAFQKLRSLSKMKSFLNHQQLQILTQGLVLSSLDYCNALYFGIEHHLINQLQCIQNSACRVIFGLKRKEYVAGQLKELHWLKIQERIEFKLLTLVYKCLNGITPQYI